jgi:hypothetical protein
MLAANGSSGELASSGVLAFSACKSLWYAGIVRNGGVDDALSPASWCLGQYGEMVSVRRRRIRVSSDNSAGKQRPWWSYIIYYNKDDPRTFISKWGGFNVNVAQPGGIAIWVGFFVFIGVMVYLTR